MRKRKLPKTTKIKKNQKEMHWKNDAHNYTD